ncbi:hypothetical protein MLD38_017780 [Melastoma candidum]|uniref:Uncharacterized protein n=2 Tax=Melastoma candidum TaxID=119954 RepID=A0ACB9QRP8_9MYRT|nr:hypothetical protein MLD38_017780 [Melastoma candidum]
MASVFLYHVVGDLTVGKPDLQEFYDCDTLASAILAIRSSSEGGIPVWRRRALPLPNAAVFEGTESRQQRFLGILDSLDIASFLSRIECLEDQEKAMNTPVSEVVSPNNSALRIVDPGTRLIDALEMMKQGVKRLLVPKSGMWRGLSKRFSILYNGKWLKNAMDASNSSGNNLPENVSRPSSSSVASNRDKFCCLSREDVLRFLIGCLGALAPLPLSSISSLGAINFNYHSLDASAPAIELSRMRPEDPRAVAVTEASPDGPCKIIGEISASKLWKCDYLAAAWALVNLSAGQFVMGVEDHVSSRTLPDAEISSIVGSSGTADGDGLNRPKKFSSRSIGFFSNQASSTFGASRSMYRGRSTPLTCRVTSSLAAVMTQMLSHRATHVWVTESENEDVLVGVVGYADILLAVTKQPTPGIPSNRST